MKEEEEENEAPPRSPDPTPWAALHRLCPSRSRPPHAAHRLAHRLAPIGCTARGGGTEGEPRPIRVAKDVSRGVGAARRRGGAGPARA